MSEVFNSSVLDAINRATAYSSDYIDPSTLKVIVIDGETRHMAIPEGESLFGARGDKNVERKYFQCPKIVGDNIDLSQHLIYVSYVFTDIDSTTNLPETNIGMYHCEDVAVEGDNITFSWLLSGNVLHNPGFIAFKVCAKEKESDPNTVFNTTPAIGIVLYTIPDGSEIIPEEYPDIITQLLADMDATKEEVAAQIAEIDAIKDQIEGAVEGTLINDNTESNIFTYSSQKINTELRKKATYYDSVASMKADSSLKDGSTVVTLGYYSENDGGGATYLIRTKQSGDEDDGGSIHELNGGQLVAELTIKEYVTPEMYGAVGDGITDDSDAIQNVLNSAFSMIVFPDGDYLIQKTITDNIGHNIEMGNSTIICGNMFSEEYAININSPVTSEYHKQYHYKLNISCKHRAKGILFTSSRGNKFDIVIKETLEGVTIPAESNVYENTFRVQVQNYDYVGAIGINNLRSDNVFDEIVTVNFGISVVNNGSSYYKSIHPWLWGDVARDNWNSSICFKDESNSSGATIDYLYIDCVRYGISSETFCRVYVNKIDVLAPTKILDESLIIDNNIIIVSAPSGRINVGCISGFTEHNLLKITDDQTPSGNVKIENLMLINWLSGAPIKDVPSCNLAISRYYENLFNILPAEIKEAYTDNLVYLEILIPGSMYRASYYKVNKLFISNVTPSDEAWRSISYQ